MINISSKSLFIGSLLPVIPIKQIRQKELQKSYQRDIALLCKILEKDRIV